MPLFRSSAARATSSTRTPTQSDTPPPGAGARPRAPQSQAQQQQGALQGLAGRQPMPEVRTEQKRGSQRAKISVKGPDGQAAKAMQHELRHKGKELHSTALAVAVAPGSTQQVGRMRDGTAVSIAMGPHGMAAIPSAEPVFEPIPKRKKSKLRKLVAPAIDLLTSRKASMLDPASARIAAGLTGVPSHLVTGVAATATGTQFGIGPEGKLYRFEAQAKTWAQADDIGGPYAQIGPQPDGRLYAVRASAHGAELVRLGDDELEVIHESERPVASYAASPNGTLLVLDDKGRLTRTDGTLTTDAPLTLLDADGRAPDAPVMPAAIGMAGDGQTFIAGEDGRLYRLDLANSPARDGFKAQHVPTPPTGAHGPAQDATLLDLGHTIDPQTGKPTLHALYRKPGGELFSAHYADGGFKPGWRFDNAFIAQNRNGIEPVRIPADDAVAINRDGVQLGIKRGRLHVGYTGGQWESAGTEGLSRLKPNPAGLQKSYALQTVRLPDGSEQRRLVGIELQGLHPQLPPSSDARLGTVSGAVGAKLTELASGRLRDFAVLESLGATPGDDTKRLYYVDEDNRLFMRDLAGTQPAQPLAGGDVGRIEQITLDGDGHLYALAAHEGEPPTLYRLGDDRHWQPQAVSLAPGHQLAGIETTWTGRLQVKVDALDDTPAAAAGLSSATYLFSPKTGLRPLDRQSAIDALRAAGGREFHLPGLPAVHVKNEWLGFKSTSRPFLSNTVNWFQSAWAHTRSLGSMPKVAVRWAQHKRNGREGLQNAYQATASAAQYYHRNLAGGARAQSTADLREHIARIGRQDGQLASEMEEFTAALMRNSRQILEGIGHSTGLLDANLAIDPEFKSQPPKSFDSGPDLVDDLHRWFSQHATGSTDGEAARALALLEHMRNGQNRLFLHAPITDAKKARSADDPQALLNARLVRDIQAVQELRELAATGRAEALREGFQALKARHAADPVTQYTDQAFQNVQQLEDTYDVVRSLSRGLNKWSHPLNRTVAESLSVKSPRSQRAELMKAAEAGTIDPNLLAKYGMADSASLKLALQDAKHPDHARLKTQIETECLDELRQRFVDTLLGMKTKETFFTDRSYGGGVDPFSYLHKGGVGFVFLGGQGGRNYNMAIEVMGDDPQGGDIAFALEKAREITGEVAGGWGKSTGHGDGFLDHFMRIAAIGEYGVRHTKGRGMWFMIPRDKLGEFSERLFDFGKKGNAGVKDLQQLLAPAYERETMEHSETATELKAQIFVRMGPNGYTEHAGGHFWAARPSVFETIMGIGHESSTYKLHGRRLDGELQVGKERHEYWSQEANIKLPALRFRSWFNFPTDAESEHQFAMGVGNTDNEGTLGIHNKDGAKCEYRTAPAETVRPEQWHALLDDVRQAFPAQAERLERMRGWADVPEAFSELLAVLRKEVAESWPDEGNHKKDLLGNLDVMRWQHGLALAGKPMYFGMIHEVRAANPSRLDKPASWQRLAETIYPNAAKGDDPLRRLHAQLDEDPTLKQLIRDLQATHPTRLKIKLEPTPEAVERLVQMQLENPNLPESHIAEFLADARNFRINTIAALKSSDVSNSASVWPVIGVKSGTSTSLEELKGSVHFEYDAQGQPAGYVLDSGFARHRKSVESTRTRLEKAGAEPLTLPSDKGHRGPVGNTAPGQHSLRDMLSAESGRSRYFDAEEGPDDLDGMPPLEDAGEPVATANPARPEVPQPAAPGVAQRVGRTLGRLFGR